MSRRGQVHRCVNPTQKRGKAFDQYSYRKCKNCPFLKTHKGKHWLDDWCRCTVPLDIAFREKFRYEPERFLRVREYSRRRKTGAKDA